MLTQKYLQEILSYNPSSGVFVWRKQKCKRIPAGTEAGWIERNGYRYISIDNKNYLAHRLVWLYIHGEWPCNMIDHINGESADNRLENLREATGRQNQQNARLSKSNTSGYKGVQFHKQTGKWEARLRVAKKIHYVGLFENKEEAAKAVQAAREKHHGEFYNHG